MLKNSLKKSDFRWTEEAEKYFVEMKSLLKELPTLTALVAGETLMLYLATSKEAISSVLVADRGSKALSGSEVNYPPIEKLEYALVHTAHKLCRCFQAHSIVVLTDQPIRHVLYKPEVSSRLAKWAIELEKHEINYSPRTAVKGQILADYLAETIGEVEALTESTTISCGENQVWELYIDGACGPEGAGTGLVLTSPDGEEHTYALQFTFAATNNESEYEALLSGLRIAQRLGIKHLDAYVDS
ncbi:uncharacterized protein [Rutidosis leptorrhynchoides]|uniref:uncharacterized protein n=1 Tax=Rutidosis leptorrhynchoides TaxID=125765 RepID=UPI003A9905E8